MRLVRFFSTSLSLSLPRTDHQTQKQFRAACHPFNENNMVSYCLLLPNQWWRWWNTQRPSTFSSLSFFFNEHAHYYTHTHTHIPRKVMMRINAPAFYPEQRVAVDPTKRNYTAVASAHPALSPLSFVFIHNCFFLLISERKKKRKYVYACIKKKTWLNKVRGDGLSVCFSQMKEVRFFL